MYIKKQEAAAIGQANVNTLTEVFKSWLIHCVCVCWLFIILLLNIVALVLLVAQVLDLSPLLLRILLLKNTSALTPEDPSSPSKGITESCVWRFSENTMRALICCHSWRWITMCSTKLLLVSTYDNVFRAIIFRAVDVLTRWSRESIRLTKWLVLYGECD